MKQFNLLGQILGSLVCFIVGNVLFLCGRYDVAACWFLVALWCRPDREDMKDDKGKDGDS